MIQPLFGGENKMSLHNISQLVPRSGLLRGVPAVHHLTGWMFTFMAATCFINLFL